MEINKKKQGTCNRASGARFELIVRKDMQSKGWNIAKFQNNLETVKQKNGTYKVTSDMIASKHQFRGKGIPMTIGTGFPDFICWVIDSIIQGQNTESNRVTYIMGIEVKSNGYLDQNEKAKCRWLLDKGVFNKILIAKKSKIGRKIVPEYVDFVDYIKK